MDGTSTGKGVQQSPFYFLCISLYVAGCISLNIRIEDEKSEPSAGATDDVVLQDARPEGPNRVLTSPPVQRKMTDKKKGAQSPSPAKWYSHLVTLICTISTGNDISTRHYSIMHPALVQVR